MKSSLLLIFVILIISLGFTSGQIQDGDYRLNVHRDFGFGNGADVRGNFSLSIFGSQDTIRSVIYHIDGKEMGQVSQAPFRFRFTTSDYPDGWHDLFAVVETTDGRQISTPIVRLNFLSTAQQAQGFKRILGPFLGLFLLILLVGITSQFISMRGRKYIPPGTPRNYGLLGGTICPRCNRPHPFHLWSLNFVGGRLDRCDHCGKWAFSPRYSLDVLVAAERTELEQAQAAETSLPGAVEESEEEKLRRLLDESRYRNL